MYSKQGNQNMSDYPGGAIMSRRRLVRILRRCFAGMLGRGGGIVTRIMGRFRHMCGTGSRGMRCRGRLGTRLTGLRGAERGCVSVCASSLVSHRRLGRGVNNSHRRVRQVRGRLGVMSCRLAGKRRLRGVLGGAFGRVRSVASMRRVAGRRLGQLVRGVRMSGRKGMSVCLHLLNSLKLSRSMLVRRGRASLGYSSRAWKYCEALTSSRPVVNS